MTTIKQILEWPAGYRSGGFNLVVKTPKKTITDAKGQMFHNVCLMDETGEILADVKLIKSLKPLPAGWENKAMLYSPLIKRQIIHIIRCEVQLSESDTHLKIGKHGKKLLVHEYKIVSPEFSEEDHKYSSELWELDEYQKRIVRSKIRHGIICAMIHRIQPGTLNLKLTKENKEKIEELVEYIVTGK